MGLAELSTAIANRTSRRTFLGRSGQVAAAVAGSGALLARTSPAVADGPEEAIFILVDEAAFEATFAAQCKCRNPCPTWHECYGCGSRMRKHRECPRLHCEDPHCTVATCTRIAC